jgi:hypothetical protein
MPREYDSGTFRGVKRQDGPNPAEQATDLRITDERRAGESAAGREANDGSALGLSDRREVLC